MLRALIYGLTILHLGPGIAFALLAFGCDQPSPLLGTLCERGPLESFAALTLTAWVVLLLGLAVVNVARRHRARQT